MVGIATAGSRLTYVSQRESGRSGGRGMGAGGADGGDCWASLMHAGWMDAEAEGRATSGVEGVLKPAEDS